MKRSRSSRKGIALRMLWFIELSLIVVSVLAAAALRFHGNLHDRLVFIEQAPLRALLIGLCLTGAMTAFGLYQVHVRHTRADFLLRLLLSFVCGGIVLVVIYYLLPQAYIGRGVLAISLALSLLAVLGTRLFVLRAFRFEALKQRILVFGAGRNADLINQRLRRSGDRQSFVLLGFVPVPGHEVVVDEARLVVPPAEGLCALADRLNVDEIIIAPDERRGGMPMEDMLQCVQRGMAVTDLSTFFEREAGMVPLSVVDPSWLVFSGGFDYSLPRRLTKRGFDLVAASVILLLTWPLMLLTALAVRLESSGPVLYRQVRVGERGTHFEIVKFRSMRVDAEGDGVARWASKDDDRSTRVGRFIRKTRLDELPQLFSILGGQMSFVGPRPERPQFVELLTGELRYYGVRHAVKPGLTGWAQLRYPYGASVRDADEKLKFDLFYVKNHGLVFDLLILLQTVEVVLFGRGAR
jgi:sugar transferase (PEP-CTERM system associated)